MKIKIIDGGKKPEYKTEQAACADCSARLSVPYVVIPHGKRTLIPLGFALELTEGLEAVIRPRSGLTSREIDVAQGTIDSDYRGELKACLINNSEEDFTVFNLDRICQLKIQETKQFSFEIVEELSETKRGDGGFGSTGIK